MAEGVDKSLSSTSESIPWPNKLRRLHHLPSQCSSVDIWTGSLSLVKSVSRDEIGGSMISFLTGGVFIEGEGLLLTYFNNKRLLLFDDDYNYVRHFDVHCEPSDVTKGFTPNEVLVSFLIDSSIMRYSLQGGVLTTVGKINAPNGTWGIAVLGENLLVGTPQDIQIIKTDGTSLKSFKTCGQYAHVAISPGGQIYHKDDDVIVCRSRDGEELSRLTFWGLRDVRGVTVDRDGNIYVCGMRSGNVRVMSADEDEETELLPESSSISMPWAVILHPTREEILVTSFRQTVAFEVYRLCDDQE